MKRHITFGQRLRSLREEKGLSRIDFAAFLDIPQPSLYAYEMEVIGPSMDRLVQIAKRCNVSLDWLCGLADTRNFAEDLERMTNTLQCLASANDNWNKEVYQDHLRGDEE